MSGTRAACPASRNAGRSTRRVSMGVLPSTVRRNLSCGCVRRGPPSRRTSPGPAPWTARNARPNASLEPYPCRTAMLSRSPSPRTTAAAATVMRRRRTYSDSGMPANDENIRRKWYSVVPSADARPWTSGSSSRCSSTRSTSWLSAEITRPPFRLPPWQQAPRPYPTVADRSDHAPGPTRSGGGGPGRPSGGEQRGVPCPHRRPRRFRRAQRPARRPEHSATREPKHGSGHQRSRVSCERGRPKRPGRHSRGIRPVTRPRSAALLSPEAVPPWPA
ncbi:hypothetical protein SGRIM128S_07323 [Streptomyces griseomycini]